MQRSVSLSQGFCITNIQAGDVSAADTVYTGVKFKSRKYLPEGLLGWSQRLSAAKGRISYKQSQCYRKKKNHRKIYFKKCLKKRKERGRIFQLGTSLVFGLPTNLYYFCSHSLLWRAWKSPSCFYRFWEKSWKQGGRSEWFVISKQMLPGSLYDGECLPALPGGTAQVRAAPGCARDAGKTGSPSSLW